MIPVPPPSDAPALQDFPPSAADHLSWPRDIAVSPNGRTLLVALNLADAAAVIDTATATSATSASATTPTGPGSRRDGRFGLVSSETQGTVVGDRPGGGQGGEEPPGRPAALRIPESIAVDPKAPLAFVGNANQDTITVIDTKSMSVARTLSVERPQGVGTSPTYVSVTSDGCDLLSADSGEDAVAVFALSKRQALRRGRASRRARRRGRRRRAVAPPRSPPSRKGRARRSRAAARPRSSSSSGGSRPGATRRWRSRRRSAASSSGSPPGVSASVPTRAVPTRTPATTPTSTSICRRSSTAPPGC